MRSDLKVLSTRAFLDEDAIVRQNLLKYHQYLRIAIPPDALVRLLSDSDLGVLLEALGKIYSNASHPVVVNKVKDLANHTNKGIRLKVIDVARDSNRYHPDYRSILRSITKDPDSEVACMAAVELARFGETLSSEVVNNIKDYLLNARGMNSSVTTILYAVSAMGKDAIAIYSALTKHSSSQMRGVAWQRYLNLVKGWEKPEFWLPALNDRDSGVREKVLLSLRGRVSQLDVDEVKVLVGSKYSDVRIFAGQSFLSAEKEAIEQYGFDLLIDENSIVRATTIRAMGARRLPGWLKILGEPQERDKNKIDPSEDYTLSSNFEASKLHWVNLKKSHTLKGRHEFEQKDWIFGLFCAPSICAIKLSCKSINMYIVSALLFHLYTRTISAFVYDQRFYLSPQY